MPKRKPYWKYGINKKVYMIAIDDKLHAELEIKLRRDRLFRSTFFKGVITAYLNNDKRVVDLVADLKGENTTEGRGRIERVRNDIRKGEEMLEAVGMEKMTKEERELLFDLIAEEIEI